MVSLLEYLVGGVITFGGFWVLLKAFYEEPFKDSLYKADGDNYFYPSTSYSSLYLANKESNNLVDYQFALNEDLVKTNLNTELMSEPAKEYDPSVDMSNPFL